MSSKTLKFILMKGGSEVVTSSIICCLDDKDQYDFYFSSDFDQLPLLLRLR